MEKSTILDIIENKIAAYIPFHLKTALGEIISISEISSSIPEEHILDTPQRATEAIFEMFSGCWEDPKKALGRVFKEDKYDEIVYVNDNAFTSSCAHHMLPFFGKVHFGYLPKGRIVGLSKIPRMISVYSRRPQVQEKLTQDIVDTFMEVVDPYGCGVVIEAYHLCMMIRGVEQKPAYTKTTALRGTFKTIESTKQEFLNGIRKTTAQIWP